MLWLDRTREHWKLHVPFEGMRPSSALFGRSVQCEINGSFRGIAGIRLLTQHGPIQTFDSSRLSDFPGGPIGYKKPHQHDNAGQPAPYLIVTWHTKEALQPGRSRRSIDREKRVEEPAQCRRGV